MGTSKIVITCPPRINMILANEVRSLGYDVTKTSRMGVELQGTLNDCMYLNLHLRTGYRVLYLINSFTASNPEYLYQQAYKIRWEEIIDTSDYFSIQSYVQNDFVRDNKYANLKLKDAIADRFTKFLGKRPNSGPDTNKLVLFLHWRLDKCSLYIDTSGNTISKHSYRKVPFKAPLLEALAAATIQVSAWDRKSHFVNPMCGSGTLAIEAALMAINKPPGLLRSNFGFMHVKGYDYPFWEKIRKEAEQQVIESTPFKIIASDLNANALQATRINAQHAQVNHLITFELGDFTQTHIPKSPGVIMLNPEYGERLGEEKQLITTYQKIGDFFKKKCAGYMGYVFTGNMSLAKKIGLRTNRRIEFFNAKIDCRLLEYELYEGRKNNQEFRNQ